MRLLHNHLMDSFSYLRKNTSLAAKRGDEFAPPLPPLNLPLWHFKSFFPKSLPWWSTAWQDLCWKVQGQPWPCDSWPSGSWCDTYLWAVCEVFCRTDDSS